MTRRRKHQSRVRIGEAAVFAKCWMHGIPAYSTGGLRANFAGSDLIVETGDPRNKLWVQVKTGAEVLRESVYSTQCAADDDLCTDKFQADIVVFVSLDTKLVLAHPHDETLGFEHLSWCMVPRDEANRIVNLAVAREAAKPKRDGRCRKLGSVAVHVPAVEMLAYRGARHLVKIRGY